LKLFNVPKQSEDSNDVAWDAAEEALRTMAKDIEIEDLRTQRDNYGSCGSVSDDNPDDIFNEVATMTEEEGKEFCKSVLLIRCALVKVSQVLFDTTQLLTTAPRHANLCSR
jgi:hypothetical protein